MTAQACLGGAGRLRPACAGHRPSIYPLNKDFPVRESRRQPAEACFKIHRLTFPPLDKFGGVSARQGRAVGVRFAEAGQRPSIYPLNKVFPRPRKPFTAGLPPAPKFID